MHNLCSSAYNPKGSIVEDARASMHAGLGQYNYVN